MKGRVSRETRPARVRAPGPKPDACDFIRLVRGARPGGARGVCRHRPSVPVDHRGVSFGRERAAVAFATHRAGVVEGPRLVRVQRDLLAHAVLVVGRGAFARAPPTTGSQLSPSPRRRDAARSERARDEEERLGAGESSHRDRTRFERRRACEGGDATGASASGSTASARRGVREPARARAAAIRSRKRGRISRATIDPPVVVVESSPGAPRAAAQKLLRAPLDAARHQFIARAGARSRRLAMAEHRGPGSTPGRATRRRCARVAPLVRPALPFHPSSSVLQRPRALAVVVSALLPPSPTGSSPPSHPPRSPSSQAPRRASLGADAQSRPAPPPKTPAPRYAFFVSDATRHLAGAIARRVADETGLERRGSCANPAQSRGRSARALARPDPRGHGRGRAVRRRSSPTRATDRSARSAHHEARLAGRPRPPAEGLLSRPPRLCLFLTHIRSVEASTREAGESAPQRFSRSRASWRAAARRRVLLAQHVAATAAVSTRCRRRQPGGGGRRGGGRVAPHRHPRGRTRRRCRVREMDVRRARPRSPGCLNRVGGRRRSAAWWRRRRQRPAVLPATAADRDRPARAHQRLLWDVQPARHLVRATWI